MNDSEMGDLWTLSDREVRLGERIREKLQPVAEAIGLIAMQWNSMHNELGRIFVLVTKLDENAAYTKWNSIRSDRKQRRLLRIETEIVYADEKFREARENIIDLIDRIDRASSTRNSSVHCPFTLLIEDGDLRVIPDDLASDIPNDLAKNRHAEMLKAVDILPELQKRIDEIDELDLRAQYVLQCLRILELGAPWPSTCSPPRLLVSAPQSFSHRSVCYAQTAPFVGESLRPGIAEGDGRKGTEAKLYDVPRDPDTLRQRFRPPSG